MFDYINFNKIKGKKSKTKIRFIGLSTCGFCKKAKKFLEDNKIDFKYIYVDKLDIDYKHRLKSEINKLFNISLRYPTLIINNDDYLLGFIRFAWETKLKKLKCL